MQVNINAYQGTRNYQERIDFLTLLETGTVKEYEKKTMRRKGQTKIATTKSMTQHFKKNGTHL
jgi:hypothetical protein